MNNRTIIARQALQGAIMVRRKANIARSDPICVFDLAEKLNIEVMFVAAPSLEGMYAKASKTIVLTSQRSIGRKALTCAHEIGHWWYNHGDSIDDVGSIESYNPYFPIEQLVNDFAAHLLMPKWTVKKAIQNRGYSLLICSPIEIYQLSCQLGVSYTALIQHLRYSLKFISPEYAEKLLLISPKSIKSECLGFDFSGNLLIADQYWSDVPIDIEVGDKAIVPQYCRVEGEVVIPDCTVSKGLVLTAQKPGIGRIESKDGKWASFIRICQKDFTGRNIYRHLEESSDE